MIANAHAYRRLVVVSVYVTIFVHFENGGSEPQSFKSWIQAFTISLSEKSVKMFRCWNDDSFFGAT